MKQVILRSHFNLLTIGLTDAADFSVKTSATGWVTPFDGGRDFRNPAEYIAIFVTTEEEDEDEEYRDNYPRSIDEVLMLRYTSPIRRSCILNDEKRILYRHKSPRDWKPDILNFDEWEIVDDYYAGKDPEEIMNLEAESNYPFSKKIETMEKVIKMMRPIYGQGGEFFA